MADVQHGGLTLSNGVGGVNGIHVGQNYVFASEGAQDAQVVTAGDVGKFAFRTDQEEMWCVVSAGTGIENWRKITEFVVGTASASQDDTTSATFQTKASVELLPVNASWIIFGSALASHSNTSGSPSVRLRETTADVPVHTRNWRTEMKDITNVLSPFLVGQIITTTSDSPSKIIALQYAVASGTGTMTISDAILRVVLTT